ncbi:hypothetical protein EVAR_89366_1 [Eumeta japonica]|uniref:Uncharacterized protein n=1 Tax=Eumeta variegata TaxID=151549 RepID=A0A4C1ZUH3_EUMVA|nr:hypothetical protein EVAR_89366_1 [Eumeta japonica]
MKFEFGRCAAPLSVNRLRKDFLMCNKSQRLANDGKIKQDRSWAVSTTTEGRIGTVTGHLFCAVTRRSTVRKTPNPCRSTSQTQEREQQKCRCRHARKDVRDYLSTSTLHGLRYLGDGKLTWFERKGGSSQISRDRTKVRGESKIAIIASRNLRMPSDSPGCRRRRDGNVQRPDVTSEAQSERFNLA